jgi:hypothetical protein
VKIPALSRQFDIPPKHNFFVDLYDFLFAISPENLISIQSSLFLISGSQNGQKLVEDFTKVQANVTSYITNLQLIFNSSQVVKSITPPELSVNYTEYNTGIIKTKGNVTNVAINDLVIEFYRDTKGLAKQLYYNWLQLAFDFQTGCKRPRNFYEKNIGIFIFDRNGEPVEKTTYYGCCPAEISPEKLDVNERNLMDENVLTIHVNNGFERITYQ